MSWETRLRGSNICAGKRGAIGLISFSKQIESRLAIHLVIKVPPVAAVWWRVRMVMDSWLYYYALKENR